MRIYFVSLRIVSHVLTLKRRLKYDSAECLLAVLPQSLEEENVDWHLKTTVVLGQHYLVATCFLCTLAGLFAVQRVEILLHNLLFHHIDL